MRKIVLALVVLCLILPSLVWATNLETITVGTSTPVGFTQAKIRPVGGIGGSALKSYCTVEGNNIRYTDDGVTAPSFSGNGVGHVVTSGNYFFATYGDVTNISMIATSGNAYVQCSYYFELHVPSD